MRHLPIYTISIVMVSDAAPSDMIVGALLQDPPALYSANYCHRLVLLKAECTAVLHPVLSYLTRILTTSRGQS
jgi:hypothetical protein